LKNDELVRYWINSSNRDFRTMNNLFVKKDYHWALFLGHLVIEKLLKAYFVKYIDSKPPLTHNLFRIAEKANLELSEEQKDFLVTVTTFNIRARYDDHKLDFYKTCTKKFTFNWIELIKEFRTWIKKELSK